MSAQSDLITWNSTLEAASTQEVLLWAWQHFQGSIAMSSSFQTQSVPLLHLVANTIPGLPVLFLDTGFHFPETLVFRDRLVRQLGLNLVVIGAGENSATERQAHAPLYLTDADACCRARKVEPMRKATRQYAAWISGIRRDQGEGRSQAKVLEATSHGRHRVHPMLHWTARQVNSYIREHGLPEHPLSASGYTSIGCAPCTCKPLDPEDLRSGRWVGQNKVECGLHTLLRAKAGA